MKVIEWRPHERQERFHECNAYEAMFGGSKGGGKTETILRESTRQTSNPAYRAIIFRRTYPRLGEIIDRSHKYFMGMGATFSGKDMQLGLPAWTFPSGAKVAFGHCQNEQDKYNHQGKEFHFMGFDQIEEFTETQFLFLMAQNRTSDPSIRCYVRSTANPGGVGHGWVKKRYIDCLEPDVVTYFKKDADNEDVVCDKDDPMALSRAFFPAQVYDNPSIIDNDPNYVKRLEQLPEDDKRALLRGDWDVFKGQFFKMWRKSKHVMTKQVLPEYTKFISLDYGYANPASVGWWMVDYDGNLHRYRELYGEGRTYEQLGEEVRKMTPEDEKISYCVADPAIWGDKSHHKKGSLEGESGAETLSRCWRGFTELVKADNNRITGWGRMRIMLEEVKMTVSPECHDFIRTVPILIHDDKKVEDLNTDGEDHAADESRYAVMSRPASPIYPERKPVKNSVEDIERRERLQAERRRMYEDLEEVA